MISFPSNEPELNDACTVIARPWCCNFLFFRFIVERIVPIIGRFTRRQCKLDVHQERPPMVHDFVENQYAIKLLLYAK